MRVSTQTEWYRGYPVLEILVEGQPFGKALHFPGKRHLSFGVRRLDMLLEEFDTVERFYESKGEFPSVYQPVYSKSVRRNLVVRKHPEFRVFGKHVEAPYLQFLEGQTRFGFGLTKAGVILGVEDHIRAFVDRYRN